MIGDPKVLGPLQQAFNATDHPFILGKLAAAWTAETELDAPFDMVSASIRAWTPPPAEPSLEQRVAELELKLSAVSATMQEHETDLENFGNQIHELFNRTDPEPTAPDDYTPGQYKRARGCAPPINIEVRRGLWRGPVLRDGRDKAIKQQAIVTVLQRYHSISSFFDKSSLNRMAIEMLQEMDKDGGA